MSSSHSQRDPVERLAEEFAQRFRRGERPALAEYIAQCPERADEIRELFPALVAIEQLKPKPGDLTGDFAGLAGDLPAPRQLGDYQLVREVGRGGMGVVYEAEQISLGRRVALKVLPPQAKLNPTYLERFRREAKAAAKLHHTNIVPVFGADEYNGVPFYAMQFIAGEGLDKVLADLRQLRGAPGQQGNLQGAASVLVNGLAPASGEATVAEFPLVPPETGRMRTATSGLSISGPEAAFHRGVARLGLQVADALAYAHKQGVLHRDVKPSNLLLDAQGMVWITDFGLAKAEGSEELTQTGDIVGTIRFMAPERFEGHSLPQSDVYALGVTLYELLTLQPAFDDSNKARLIDKVLHELPLSPRKLDPRIPRDLETIVLKCLAKEPAGRYASADDLAEDLRRFLADRPIRARRASNAEKLWRWCRRNPVVAGLLGTVAALTLAVALISTAAALWLRAALTESEAAKRDQKRQLYQGHITEAKYRRFSHREGQRFASLEAIRKALRLLPELDLSAAEKQEQRDLLRDVAISCLTLPDVRLVKEWDGWPTGSLGLDIDYRGELYARSDARGDLTVRRIADDQEVFRIPSDGKPLATFDFVPDQDLLVVWRSSNKLEGWRIGETQPAFTVQETGPPGRFRVTRDGRTLVILLLNGAIKVYSLPDGTLRRQETLPETDVPVLELSPDGKYLAAVGSSYRHPERQLLHVYDLPGGGRPLILTHPDSIYSVAWYPDGKAIAAAGMNISNEIVVWEVPSGKQLGAFTTQKGGSANLTINRTGDLLASRATWGMGGVKIWHPQTGKELLTLPSSTDYFHITTPDGRIFAHERSGTRIRLMECVPSQVCRDFSRDLRSGKGEQHYMPALHPDGRLLAVGMENGVSLWDLPSGRELAFLPIGQTQSLAFDSTGALWTYGHGGLLRWPIREEAPAERTFAVGPPQTLSSTPTFNVQMDVSRDGQVAAVSLAAADVSVFHRGRAQRPVRIRHQLSDVRNLAVSPDGRFVVGRQHQGLGVKVWDAVTGRVVVEPTPGDGWGVGFTDDGKWLVVGSRWFQVGTWHEGPAVPGWHIGSGCVSRDGKLLAGHTVAEGEQAVALIDRATGRRLARLGSPGQARVYHMTFTPDATRLIGTDEDNLVTHVWDLRQLRAELQQLDLDWDAPAFPPAPDLPTAAVPQLRVDLGSLEDDMALGHRPTPEHLRHLVRVNSALLAWQPFHFKAYRQRGRAYGMLNDPGKAIADYSLALLLMPADDAGRAELLARRAGNHATGGDAGQAFADLREAERLDPVRAAAAREDLARSLLRRTMQTQRREAAAALRDLRLAVRLDPELGIAHNNLAWLLLTGPPNLRAPAEALRHASRAAELADRPRIYDNTVGVALYRNGQYARAILALERSLAGGGEYDAYDLYFLAMCHARLGARTKAQECFERAVRWVESKPGLRAADSEELRQFRAEAEAVLRER